MQALKIALKKAILPLTIIRKCLIICIERSEATSLLRKELSIMTKTIKSQTSNTHYFLTIECGLATDCTCPDRQYRRNWKHTCKHMNSFNAEVVRASAFLNMKELFDVRENGQEQSKRCYFEMSLGY